MRLDTSFQLGVVWEWEWQFVVISGQDGCREMVRSVNLVGSFICGNKVREAVVNMCVATSRNDPS